MGLLCLACGAGFAFDCPSISVVAAILGLTMLGVRYREGR